MDTHAAKGIRIAVAMGVGIGLMAGAALGMLDHKPGLTDAQIIERARILGMERLTDMPKPRLAKAAAPEAAPAAAAAAVSTPAPTPALVAEPKVRLAVLVRKDSTLTEVALMLKDAGLISDPQTFIALALASGAEASVQAGIHVFTLGDTQSQLLDNLQRFPRP